MRSQIDELERKLMDTIPGAGQKAKSKRAQKFREDVSAHPALLLASVFWPGHELDDMAALHTLLHDEHFQLIQDAASRQQDGSKDVRDKDIRKEIESASLISNVFSMDRVEIEAQGVKWDPTGDVVRSCRGSAPELDSSMHQA